MGIENMSNEQMKEVIKKVQKLLALAQSDNENEARLALQKAQELQAKYNIVFDQLDIEDESQKVIEEKYDAPDTESLNSLFKMMACNLADHYRVKTYINVHREWGTVDGKYQRTTKKQLVVVGLPFDVEVFKQSLFFAYNAMRKLATTFVRQVCIPPYTNP
jgi:ribosomal protein L17